MRFLDEPLAFETSERFADRRLRDVELLDEIVDRDPRTRRDLQGHELRENRLVYILDEAVRPRNVSARCTGFGRVVDAHRKSRFPLDKGTDITMLPDMQSYIL